MTTISEKKALLNLIKPHRKNLFLGLGFALVANSFDAIAPYVLKTAFDTFQHPFIWKTIWFYGGILVFLASARGVLRYYMRMTVVGVSRDVEFDLRTSYFQRLLSLPAKFFDKNRTGDLMSRATSDIENIRMMTGPALMYLANTFVTMIVGFTVMVMLSHSLTLAVIVLIPIGAVAIWFLGQAEFQRTDEQQEKYSELSAAVQDNLAGARVIRAYAQEEREVERMEVHNKEFFRRSYRLLKVDAMYGPVMGVLFSFGFVAILWYGGHLLAQDVISLGTFVAFVSYLGLLAWPIIAIGWTANLIQRGLASWARIYRILLEEPEIDTGVVRKDIVGELQFDHVTLQYTEDRTAAIQDVSFTIPSGGSLGIVGRTGSGKSTIASLIARLYEPSAGSIRCDGVELGNYPLPLLRSQIGFVPQEAFLFSASVAENIAFGKIDAAPDRIESSSHLAALSKDIDQLSDGYKSLVGERGVTLSGGQKQRVAIARALLIDPRILVLDDPLANVDTATERAILNSLEEYMKGRTTVIIAHRTSTVMNCDAVLVLDRGQIVQYGDPRLLAQEAGPFAELVERQRLTEELAEVA